MIDLTDAIIQPNISQYHTYKHKILVNNPKYLIYKSID